MHVYKLFACAELTTVWHIFRFPDLTCWHFEYKITLPLLYISKGYIAQSDKIARSVIATFHAYTNVTSTSYEK